MVLDELFDGITNKDNHQLSLHGLWDVDELYNEWYKLQISKVDLQKSYEVHSEVTYKILGHMIAELSPEKSLEATKALSKIDANANLEQHKEKLSYTINNQISDIDSRISTIRERLEQYAKSKLYSDDFFLELIIKPAHHLRSGTLQIKGIRPDLRMPIYYLFNDTVPNFNLGDDNLTKSVMKYFPQDARDIMDAILTSKYGTKEYLRSLNFSNYFRDYSIKYFGRDVNLPLSIPLFLDEENGTFYDPNMNDRTYDTNMRQFRIAVSGDSDGIVYIDLNHCYKNSEGYKMIVNDKKDIYGTFLGSYSSCSGRNNYGRMEMEFLSSAAGRILAQFFKNNLQDRIKPEEIIVRLIG